MKFSSMRLTLFCALFSAALACGGDNGTSGANNNTVDSDAGADSTTDADAGTIVDEGVVPECTSGADCDDGVCFEGSCVAPTCADGVANGAETDIDCGGADCGPCEIGNACVAAADCLSSTCDAETCVVAPTCDDQSSNGLETDVDCGGADCDACQDGQVCAVGSDCFNGVCDNGLCAAPTCEDGVTNSAETDADCGGADCDACAVGKACTEDTDCVSGVCQAGICGAAVWTDVSTHTRHTCGVRSDGSLWCWGSNTTSGILGMGDTADSFVPKRVGTDSNWAQVSAGLENTCAVRTDGTLWCWGERRALGRDSSILLPPSYYSPLQVGQDTDWVSVSVGYAHACAKRTDNSLWCWGRSFYGQIGDGTDVDRPEPISVGAVAV